MKEKLTYDIMDKIRKDLGLAHNSIFCGYNRNYRPIEILEHGNVIVRADCNLDGHYCKRIVNHNNPFSVEECPVYKKVFIK